MTENSAITAYFNKIGAVPLLTKDEERTLLARVKNGDGKARSELIERNLKLVIPTAKQYIRSGIPFADLIQEGSVAVVKACDKFDLSAGTKFSTYATYWIRQRIGRYVKKHSKNVFVPEHIVNLAVQIAKVKRILEQDGNTDPTNAEIAQALATELNVKTDAETVRETLECCQTETSMCVKIGDDGETELGDLLEDSSARDPSDELNARLVSEKLSAGVCGLTRPEREIIMLRYGIGVPAKGLTILQIAKILGVSETELSEIAKSVVEVGSETRVLESA